MHVAEGGFLPPELLDANHFDTLDRSVWMYSLGQQQYLAGAMALCSSKDIVILDEPYSFLDSNRAASLTSLINNAREAGKTVIVLGLPSDHSNILKTIAPDQFLHLDCGRLAPPATNGEAWITARIDLPVSEPGSGFFNASQIVHRYSRNCPSLVYQFDLGIGRGESIGICANNGVGKTTYLMLLAGLYWNRRCRVELSGIRLCRRDARRRIRCCFQNPDFQVFGNSASEEFAFALKRSGNEEPIDSDHLQMIYRSLPFDLESDPFALSYGQRKLLSLATSFAQAPSVLILDEPLAGLDNRAKSALDTMMLSHLDQGRCIVVSSTNRMEVHSRCHRHIEIGLLEDGMSRTTRTIVPLG